MYARKLVGRNIRRVRLLGGISQTDLVRRIEASENGMTQAYISQLENGLKNISIDKLAVIAKALGVRLSDLVIEDQNPTDRP